MQMVFVKEIRQASENKTSSTMVDGEENSGARFNKYRPGWQGDAEYWSNDWIMYRLTDMICLGAFTTGTWWDYQPSNATKKILPVPQRQLTINPTLKQNPGYPEQ